jgi:hypothetical protein
MAKPKLTREDCADLRRMYADKTRNVRASHLAHLFKVTTGTVNRVLNNHYVPLEDYQARMAARPKRSKQ